MLEISYGENQQVIQRCYEYMMIEIKCLCGSNIYSPEVCLYDFPSRITSFGNHRPQSRRQGPTTGLFRVIPHSKEAYQ